MYVNEYTNLAKALELLRSHGDLSLSRPGYGASVNEETAYNTLAADLTLFQDDLFIHEPSKRMLLLPKVGMGATLHYPSDCYPYEITKVVSLQTLEVRRMNHHAVPGWVADFTPGGFCGHIHNLHEQKFTYTSDPNGRVERIRLNKRGRWMRGDTLFTVGHSSYFVDRND
jgi:hypothetical protein